MPPHDLSVQPAADICGDRTSLSAMQASPAGQWWTFARVIAALVQNHLHKDPFTGTVYVFRSKRADRLKLLYWDGSGLVMAYKRLEDHVFKWPAISNGMMRLNHAQFEALFAGLDWRKVHALEVRPPAAAE